MFSVVVPIYNHAAYLAQAVWSALRDPLVGEILLLDDGSTDGSAKIAAEMAAAHPHRVRDLSSADGGNRGAHHRLNELIGVARSEWIAVLNSDDVFVNGRFEAIAADTRFPHCDFFFGSLLLMNQRGALTGAKRGPLDPGVEYPPDFHVSRMVAEGRFLDLLAHQNYLGTTSNMIFRKALHARAGGFAGYRYVHDWDFGLRAMSLGRPRYIQRFLTAYRWHAHNTISESAAGVERETKDLFRRFAEDFPYVVKRPGFRLGMESNPLLGHRIPTP